ncbi:1-(5-phosphoribosyl)-5- imidazole-4-carboxamide isomerase [Phytophthora nicotianae]|uniref:1-(5-phosphoribosyl)-5-imidazole-4-carboxamide isomerase n=1 Tax=Phytophthora nicotianae TaxID=4792 RepID=A0A0W8DRF9_PHYNI|nr:1-(5-phosphoribosyl)-5- imidazole-4-carboxamide isomerase [Phytophthora nicotianae]
MVGVARFLSAAIGGDDDADNVQGKWIGLAIVITSAVLSNLGVNVQKLSHVRTVVLGGIFGQIEAILRLPRALNENKYRLLPFMYATASGIFGSFSVLLAKTDLLNRAIMAGDTLSVFPMFQCFWIGVIGGVVFYEKYTRFSLFDWLCLPIALASDTLTATTKVIEMAIQLAIGMVLKVGGTTAMI